MKKNNYHLPLGARSRSWIFDFPLWMAPTWRAKKHWFWMLSASDEHQSAPALVATMPREGLNGVCREMPPDRMLPTPTRPQIYFFSVCVHLSWAWEILHQKKIQPTCELQTVKPQNHITNLLPLCYINISYQLFKTTGPTMFPMCGTHLFKPPHLPLQLISSSVRYIKHTVFHVRWCERRHGEMRNGVRTRRNLGVKWRNCECEKNLEVCGHVSERIERSKLW